MAYNHTADMNLQDGMEVARRHRQSTNYQILYPRVNLPIHGQNAARVLDVSMVRSQPVAGFIWTVKRPIFRPCEWQAPKSAYYVWKCPP
jgi:hypothetical protein